MPIHPAIDSLIDTLIKHVDERDGYLIPRTAGNKYGELIGKRFGRMKTAMA